MRPLVSSSVLYVDLLLSTSTTSTTPSSQGILSVDTRSSWPRLQAWVTEAILSTTRLFTVLLPSAYRSWSGITARCLSFMVCQRCALPERPRQGQHFREAQRIGRAPFARRFSVYALGGGHQRILRGDAFDKQTAGAQEQMHFACHAFLAAQQQSFDVAANRIEVLAFMDQVSIRLRHRFLDARLSSGQHELLQLAMRGQQDFRRRRFEGDATFGADDGIAQMNAAADGEGCPQGFQRLDQLDGRHAFTVET